MHAIQTPFRHRWLITVLKLLGLLVGSVFVHAISAAALFDDAYITFRYARNLSVGLGFVYNPGEYVLGTTTPLFTGLLALGALIGGAANLPLWARVMAVVCEAANMGLMYRLARWAFGHKGVAVGVMLVYTLQPFRAVVATKGMETSLSTLWLLLLYHHYLTAPRKQPLWLAALMTLGFLTRPDALIAYVPLALHWVQHDFKALFKTAMFAAVGVAPWLLWATWYFGSPLSHSLIAKAAHQYPAGLGLFFLATFFATGTLGPYVNVLPLLPLLGLALVGAGLGLRYFARQCPALLVVGSYPILYAGLMSVTNAPVSAGWYYLPLFPGCIFLLTGAIWGLPRLSAQHRWALLGGAAICAVGLPLSLMQLYPGWTLSNKGTEAYQRLCDTVKTTLQPGQMVMAPDIGVIGWCLAEARIFDPVGLVSPAALAPRYLQAETLIAPVLIFEQQPDYIVTLAQYISPSIIADPAFTQAYKVLVKETVAKEDGTVIVYVFQRVTPKTMPP